MIYHDFTEKHTKFGDKNAAQNTPSQVLIFQAA